MTMLCDIDLVDRAQGCAASKPRKLYSYPDALIIFQMYCRVLGEPMPDLSKERGNLRVETPEFILTLTIKSNEEKTGVPAVAQCGRENNI